MSDAVESWVEVAADALSFVIHNMTAVQSLSKTVLDGSLPPQVFEKLIAMTKLKSANLAGYRMQRPEVSMGSWGKAAPALGAALYVLERQVFAA
jgi:predicted NBD/HSP70 family sugar kinase